MDLKCGPLSDRINMAHLLILTPYEQRKLWHDLFINGKTEQLEMYNKSLHLRQYGITEIDYTNYQP